MKNRFIKLSILLVALGSFIACTDLELEDTDSVSRVQTTGDFTGVSDVAGSLSNAYNSLRTNVETHENLYGLNEGTSDELLIPTRGTDWGDNGVWRTLHQHTWDANHNFVLNTWNEFNSAIFNLTEIIAPESDANAQQIAEAKFLRAFHMYWIMDLYGQVPFREVDEGPDVNPRVMTRSEAFEFVMQDLNEAMPDLPSIGPGNGTVQASKAAAHYLLAKLYLNKHIYLAMASAEAADMTAVIDHVDAIIGAGFELQEGFFEIFEPSDDTETILYTTSSAGNRMWSTLHYAQGTDDNAAGGWNGFSTLAEFYDLFEGDENVNTPGSGQEERRGYVPLNGNSTGTYIGKGFLINQQYAADGSELTDRAGNPLVFTKDLPGLLGNNERNGIRVLKYHPSNGAYTGHVVVFRFADAYLMKAEAIMRGGSSSEDALTMVNDLRELREASPLPSLSEQDMLDERGRELYTEYWRRQDQIRFGTFTSTWEFKDNTEEFRVLFPIPSVALTSNPNLTQNPGY
ncbi:RagB/SusD family nutrient uptake outer membrane protein [Zunongwangia sp. HRR-M8]|uniref:RagB/SusD family nutrient uptake outer membrane protein n=1 Tax=Zunongwangia sp. HRR-M8 TaxID=3015170 RepID=UPI0022DDE1FE|nr:RagB/SusD family nutrient uptake outer membrane protein [Zunongwangia sp. HRR-M8]WBL21003.1 RagB/SusD family nutrient uptake outer membrane protein [Zunongwangia sp. HRR-M8]